MEFFFSFLFSFLALGLGVAIAHLIKAQIAVAEYKAKFQWALFFKENRNPMIINSLIAAGFGLWIASEATGLDAFLDNFGFAWALASRVGLGLVIIPNLSYFFVKHKKIKEREI